MTVFVPEKMNMKSYLKFLSRNKLYTAIEAVGQRWGKKKRKTASEVSQMRFLSDSYRTQTCNLLIRSQMLYSIELRSRLALWPYSFSAE